MLTVAVNNPTMFLDAAVNIFNFPKKGAEIEKIPHNINKLYAKRNYFLKYMIQHRVLITGLKTPQSAC